MTRYQLYKLLRHNDDLRESRHPMFQKNLFMKILIGFMFVYYAAILLLLGITLPMGFSGMYNGVAAFHVLDGFVLIVIVCDFWCRFVLQETPAHQVKPYRLLPVRRSFLLNVYLVRAALSWGNLFWGFMLVPFGLMTIPNLLGWSGLAGWWLGWWLLIVANSYMYMLTRAMCMKNVAWALVPLTIHILLLSFLILEPSTWSFWEPMTHWQRDIDMSSTLLMYDFARWKAWPYLMLTCIIALSYLLNYHIQGRMLYHEVGKQENVNVSSTTSINWLNRYGALGEYLKMEIKLRLRNRQVRMQFFVGLGIMTILSLLLDFSDIYDNAFMTSFICLYDYIVLGMMTLITILCYEGNYMDGLMSRRESIYELLRAKYYFNVLLLLVPIILLIPSIVIGKIGIWMNLGYLLFTAGVLYPMIFQLAVYNSNTLPLNQKLTGKQANTMQNIVSMLVLFLPIGFEKLMILLAGDPWGYVVLMVTGIAGLLTHKWWLRNIYRRFIARRYSNMEGFRLTKNS
ncbi:MAG: hypothetical protein J6I54_02875 [Bacteroidaceae bacterium]|nr:hypothetical protein [Bacteroidaceae bacterium]